VVIRNEYRLPARLEQRDVLLDVGAHVGSFTYAALKRGAGAVYCCEADPDNFRLLRHNMRPYADRARLSFNAVWRSDQAVSHLHFDNPNPRATGAGGVSAGAAGRTVPARAFDDLVSEATRGGRRIRLVKLDCEGSEWPILLTSRKLDLVDSLAGEYHLGDYSGPFAVDGFPEFTPAVLERHLTDQGFRVRTLPLMKNPALGHFFAERVGAQARAA
jgi:FkbM family methyltransferase